MKTKICSKCHIEKPIDNFNKDYRSKKGIRSVCKQCVKEKYQCNKKEILANANEYYTKNRKHILSRVKDYYTKHKDLIQEYRQQNKEHLKEYSTSYHKTHQKQIRKRKNKYDKHKRTNNPLYKLQVNIRNRIRICLKSFGYSKKSNTYKIIGCSFEELLNYLFENAQIRYCDFDPKDFLKKNKYQIHHIIFLETAKTEEEIIKLNHYTNLELLTVEDHKKVHSCNLLLK